MTQHPNEKDMHSVYPGQQGTPPQNPPYPYTSAPAPSQSNSFALPYQSQYPPEGPPPDYDYVKSHPAGSSHATPPLGPYESPADAGPSSSSTQDGGIMMSIASFFGNRGPPPMWQRQVPSQLQYSIFPPMCLISNSKDLSKGFPELPPPCELHPHPFATHDVMEEDWKRFLADVKKAGSLSPAQRVKSNVIPAVTGMSLVSGLFATFAIEKRMKAKNRGAAGDLVDHWNHYFFGPRKMEVVLCQGSEALSGKLGSAPVGDPQQERMARRLRKRNDDSDSDSSSDEHEHGHDHGVLTNRKARRRERREARRERRAERRERRARGENQLPYRLFVTAI